MFAAIGNHALFEMLDGAVCERRSLLDCHRARRKLFGGKSRLLAWREMADHALHHFFLDRVQQLPHVRVRTDPRHPQRRETFRCVVSEPCPFEQMLEGIGISVPLRQEVRQVKKFLYCREHGGMLVDG